MRRQPVVDLRAWLSLAVAELEAGRGTTQLEEEVMSAADRVLDEGAAEDALRAYRALLARRSADPNAHLLDSRPSASHLQLLVRVGHSLVTLGKPGPARAFLQEALRLRPGSALATLLVGRLERLERVRRIAVNRARLAGVRLQGPRLRLPEGAPAEEVDLEPDMALETVSQGGAPGLRATLELARDLAAEGEIREAMRLAQSANGEDDEDLCRQAHGLRAVLWLKLGQPALCAREALEAPGGLRAWSGAPAEVLHAIGVGLEKVGKHLAARDILCLCEKAGGYRDSADRLSRLEEWTRTLVEGAFSPLLMEDAGAPGPELVPGVVAVQELGRGGECIVHKGRLVDSGDEVAVRVLRPSQRDRIESVRRFERQGRLQARIRDTHVVSVIRDGTCPEGPYLITELVRGPSLEEVLQAGRLEWQAVEELSLGIARALAAVHGAGVVHLDIKPGNIRLEQGTRPKLLDFGLARDSSDESLLAEGPEGLWGTLHYLAPELIEGGQPTARADVYAFGVCLHEMVAGAPPFDSPDPHSLMFQHLTRPPTPLTDLREDVPPGLDALVTRCLAKRPEERPADGTALLSDLSALLE